MKKMKKMLFSIILSLILCIPSFAANASQLSDYYGGTWWDLNSQRCYMEITPYNDAAFITVSWGSSAFETYEWTMTGLYNPATGKYHYNNCTLKLLTSDAYGNDVEIVHYVNGTGAIYIATNGYLYWEDNVEQAGINCYFEKEVAPNWIGTYVSADNQIINISAYNDSCVLMTYTGYSEEGWRTWTKLLPYRYGSTNQLSNPYYNDIDGRLIQETVYTLTDGGINIEVLPAGGWDEGFYARQY